MANPAAHGLHRLLTVVMPVYNEAATLRDAVERFLKSEQMVDTELLVVDDGSTDGSVGTISDLVDDTRVRVLGNQFRKGKGGAVRTGIVHARGQLLSVLDADLEYSAEDFRELVPPILMGDATVTYGTRTFGAHTIYSFWYVLGNRFLSFWASFLYNTWLSDMATCLKVAPTDVWRSMDLKSSGFGFDAEATAKFLKAGHRIYEVPIHYRARGREEGKKLRWTDGLVHLWILFKVRLVG
jgi:glycosyltransferase involved in cell wall biosynthesis